MKNYYNERRHANEQIQHITCQVYTTLPNKPQTLAVESSNSAMKS